MMCFSRTSFARDWRNRNRIFFQFSSRKMKQIGSGQWIWFVVSLFYFRWCIRYVFCGFFALDIEKWEKRLLISRNYRRSFIHVIFRFHLFHYSRCFVDFSLNFFFTFLCVRREDETEVINVWLKCDALKFEKRFLCEMRK